MSVSPHYNYQQRSTGQMLHPRLPRVVINSQVNDQTCLLELPETNCSLGNIWFYVSLF